MPVSTARFSLIVLVTFLTLAADAADAVVDAKRRAAADLMREGKTSDAIALTNEVIASDGDNYKDFLLLARCHDKAGNSQQAVDAYRKVLSLLPSTAKSGEERAAHAEADRRLKILDAQSPKIEAAVDEFSKKLDALQREAELAKSSSSLVRIARLKAAVWRGDPKEGRAALEVSPVLDWQASGFRVAAGDSFQVKVIGAWRMGRDASTECTGAGLQNVPANQYGPVGMMLATIDGKGAVMRIGQGGTFTAGSTGQLLFGPNEVTAKSDNSGFLIVFVERR